MISMIDMLHVFYNFLWPSGPDNKVIEEVLENSTVLSDIIDTIIKSPERNVELPLFESEANDQQIQVRSRVVALIFRCVKVK